MISRPFLRKQKRSYSLLAGRNILISHLLFTSHLANSHPSPSPFDTAANKKPASGPCGFFICLKELSVFRREQYINNEAVIS